MYLDFFDAAPFAAALADRRIIAAAVVAALAGAVRGFTGFGSAMIYIPLVSAIYGPRLAVTTLLLVDFVSSAPFSVAAFWRCNWREVLPVSVVMAATIPLGALLLVFVDPIVLRWFIAFLVIGLIAVLASGWRYRGGPTLAASVTVGAVAGIGSGAVQIAGPAVVIYWLGGLSPAAVVRANLMVVFLISDFVSTVTYTAQGLLTAEVLVLSVLLGGPFLAAMIVGAWMFRGSSDVAYRRVAYVIIAVSAVLSLPVFDRIFR
jgi:uncharacterized membrane protein YfcA